MIKVLFKIKLNYYLNKLCFHLVYYNCKTRENFKFKFFKKKRGGGGGGGGGAKTVIYRNSPEKSWDFS